MQIWNGTQLIVDGTSASTPTMAAVVSLVNDALLAAGKPVLGWLNPWLYQHGGSRGFVDVVSGSAAGCNTTGFPAAEGWDAVTGFGSPVSYLTLSAINRTDESSQEVRQASACCRVGPFVLRRLEARRLKVHSAASLLSSNLENCRCWTVACRSLSDLLL